MKCIRRRSREVFGRRAAAAVAATVLVVGPVAGAGATQADDSPATGRPGDVVRMEPIPALIPGVDAWKIFYRSTDALGNPSVVSGRVFVPQGGGGTRPLVTYAVGTIGMGDQCAPSATIGPPELGGMLEKGWAVAVTDYPGLGTPGDHPYLVGRSEGTAVLDAARAAQRLPDAGARGISTESPVGIAGYSQGGHASSWAAELSHDYAPELQVKALAAGGVPADNLGSAQAAQGKPVDPASYLMIAGGHDTAYPELHLDSYLTDEGRDMLRKIRSGCIIDNLIAGVGKPLDRIVARDILTSPDWRKRLGEDRLGTRAPGFPVYLFHGTNDQVVAYQWGEQLRSDWCRAGNPVEWHSIPVADHVGTASAGGNAAMDWLARRLDGEPAAGNCSG